MSRTVTAVGLCLTAVLGLTACGGAKPSAGHSANNASASQSQGTGSSLSGQAGAVKVGDVVDGATLTTRVLDATKKAGSGRMTMALGTQTWRSEFAFAGATMNQHLTIPVQGRTVEMITSGGVIYIKGMPGSTKPWVKIDPKGGKDPMSKLLGSMTNNGLTDPRAMVQSLKGTKARVTGVSGSHTAYELTLDPKALLKGRPAAPSMAPVRMVYTIDSQNRPVTVKTSVQGRQITITYSDWGTPVTITKPPSSQVGTYQIRRPTQAT